MICSKFQASSFKKRGFTLIEIVVVTAIFSIIIVTVIGVFISAIRTQRYCLTAQQLLDQTSYTIEYMGRMIRMAKKDDNGSCTVTPKSNYWLSPDQKRLKFKNYHTQCQEFYFEDSRLYQKIGIDILPLTSNDLEIKNTFKFYLSGETQDDNLQPRVTIFMEAEGIHSDPRPKIKIQTTLSQRDLDVFE